jgi:uncharacterized membrane protein (Fun14 family)
MISRSNAAYGSNMDAGFFANIIEKIKFSQDKILQYGIAAGIGFLVGFLVKKFSAYVAIIIAGCLFITVLSHFGIMNVAIDWDKMQTMVGFEPIQFTGQNIFNLIWEWVRLNVAMTLCSLGGFFIGLKIG